MDLGCKSQSHQLHIKSVSACGRFGKINTYPNPFPPINHVLAKGSLRCLGSLRNHQMLELCFIFLKKLAVA